MIHVVAGNGSQKTIDRPIYWVRNVNQSGEGTITLDNRDYSIVGFVGYQAPKDRPFQRLVVSAALTVEYSDDPTDPFPGPSGPPQYASATDGGMNTTITGPVDANGNVKVADQTKVVQSIVTTGSVATPGDGTMIVDTGAAGGSETWDLDITLEDTNLEDWSLHTYRIEVVHLTSGGTDKAILAVRNAPGTYTAGTPANTITGVGGNIPDLQIRGLALANGEKVRVRTKPSSGTFAGTVNSTIFKRKVA